MHHLTVGVFGSSRKKQERRVPIHPEQLPTIDSSLRDRLYFEEGYGLQFGISDDMLASQTGGILSRDELFEKCDISLLAKPIKADFDQMREGSVSWGWPHCVQQQDITQTAIDRKLTLIAWEAMHSWSPEGKWQKHTFNKNNEIAGYAGVQHAMNLLGVDGHYGPARKALIISYGSVSLGSIIALKARGISDITVFTHKDFTITQEKIEGINFHKFDSDDKGNLISLNAKHGPRPFIEELKDIDIIVNGILQDTDSPLMIIPKEENDKLKSNSIIIDISCDEGMAFSFAKPTDFVNPYFKENQVYYYAVDHTPSYLWNAASWEISKAVIEYLPIVMGGSSAWDKNDTIKRAIEIKNGIIQNPKILSFQKRDPSYPHIIE